MQEAAAFIEAKKKNLLVKGKVVCKLNERFCCISVNYFFG